MFGLGFPFWSVTVAVIVIGSVGCACVLSAVIVIVNITGGGGGIVTVIVIVSDRIVSALAYTS